jgi:hypothetical protein
MNTAPVPPLLLPRPDDDDRGARPPPPLRARKKVLNHPGCLSHILAFVPDSYRFVAPVSRIFFVQYLTAHDDDMSTRTLLVHAVATPRTAQIWLNDGRPLLPLVLMAARLGRLDVLRYLHDLGGGWPLTPDVDGYDICMAAAPGGHLHIWEWALNSDVAVWDVSMALRAARDGYLEVLRFAQSCDYPMSGHEFRLSAQHGHLNVVMYLHEQGIPWEVDTCASAAQGGHLHILQWLRANDCPWDADTCSGAAEGGHLHVLQWARTNECPWDVDTCRVAAQEGHLHVLQWARTNGCPCDAQTCAAAAARGDLPMLQWARAHRCPWNELECGRSRMSRYLAVGTSQWLSLGCVSVLPSGQG